MLHAGGQMQRLEALERRHQVHLWYVLPDEIVDERLLATYWSILSPDEIERNRRFVFPKGRHEHVVTRALVRTTLSAYHPAVPPSDWRFVANQAGRPEIAGPGGGPALRFNVSHTDGLIVCLVGLDREIGVDVEDTARTGIGGVAIADHYFSPTEVAALRTVPVAMQPDRFFDYWTLKESYIKARGLGLQLPLDQFSFHLPAPPAPSSPSPLPARLSGDGPCWPAWKLGRGGPNVSISFGPGIDDDPTTWQFVLHSLTPRHRLAVAIRRQQEPDLTVLARQVVPAVRR
jgi:4'-phosphopantetheinyl transferase